jgi:hypothetical protein
VVCPPQLFDGLIWLADRRLAVITVKLRPELAAIARRRLAAFPAAEVLTHPFQDRRPNEAGFMP